MDHSATDDQKGDSSKKTALEDLSKEELIKKCRNILIIAQKAKHSRDELYIENEKRKKENEAAKEIIDALMQQKVTLTLEIDNLKKSNKKIDELEIENESYKRQTNRLTDENEELLKHLDVLEKKISDLNKIGLEQQQQLLSLLQANKLNNTIKHEDSGLSVSSVSDNFSETGDRHQDATELSELKSMLSRSLEEIKILRSEKDILNITIKKCESEIIQKDKSIADILKTKNETRIDSPPVPQIDCYENKLNLIPENIKDLQNEIAELHSELTSKDKTISFLQSSISNVVDELHLSKIVFLDLVNNFNSEQLKNIKYKEKIQSYHTKLMKFITDVKELKVCKNHLLETIKQHNLNMDIWQSEMKIVASKISEYINNSENGKDSKISVLTAQCNELKSYISELQQCNFKLENEKTELMTEVLNKITGIEDQKTYNEDKVTELEHILSQKENLLTNLEERYSELKLTSDEIKKIKMENESLKHENNNLILQIEELTQSLKLKESSCEFQITKFRDSNKSLNDKINELQLYLDSQYEKYENEHEILRNENESLLKTVEEMKQENRVIENKYKEDLNNLIQNQSEIAKRSEENKSKNITEIVDLQEQNNEIRQMFETLKLKDSMNSAKTNELQNEILVWKMNHSQEQDKVKELEEKIINLLKDTDHLNATLTTNMSNYETEKSNLKKENETLSVKISVMEQKIQQQEFISKEQIDVLQENNKELLEEIQSHKSQNDNQLLELQEKYSENCEIINELNQKLEQQAFIESELLELKQKNIDLSNSLEAQRSIFEEIHVLKETNHKLVQENQTLNKLKQEIEEQMNKKDQILYEMCVELGEEKTKTDNLIENKNEMEQNVVSLQNENHNLNKQLTLLKQENNELLSEMNEMIQELKQRGEKLSKLQEINSELQKKANEITHEDNTSHKEKLMQKEEIIQKLEAEIEVLKEKLNNIDYQNDSMSTSTISRADEANRLSELEGTWEERYSKLKQLAIRLKKRGTDLNQKLTQIELEKNELKEQILSKNKEIEIIRNENEKMKETLKTPLSSSQASAIILSDDTESIQKLKSKIDILCKDEATQANLNKELKTELELLKENIKTEKSLKQELEYKVVQYETELKSKEKALSDELAKHKLTKEQLAKLSKESKKKSVLSLEMEDYERSLKDVSQKLEAKQIQISTLESTIDTQSSTISALREQIRSLDNTIINEEENSKQLKNQLSDTYLRLTEVESVNLQKDLQIKNLETNLETEKAKNEDLSLNLAKLISEHKKSIDSYVNERDQLKSVIFNLEEKLRNLTTSLQLSEQEVSGLKSQFEGYKVRAVSVLKQSKTNGGVGHNAQQLLEEVTELQAQIDTLQSKLESTSSQLAVLTEENSILLLDKSNLEEQSQELLSVIESLRSEHDQLMKEHMKKLSEHNEAIRAQKIRNDTLSQCYRQQISELEEKYNKDINLLREKLEEKTNESVKSVPPKPIYIGSRLGNLEDKLDITSMEREEGEGSESVDLTSSQQTSQKPVPLDQLLSENNDIHLNINSTKIVPITRPMSPLTELRITKQQLLQNETRVTHLTGLLSDAELDLAKLSQLNQVLKEEIRRHQRSVEREQHAENLEYLKNVIFKFITLGNSDEKTHLVPVLTTILKLSPEETQKLNSVAKGIDITNRSWGSYIPLPKWPGS